MTVQGNIFEAIAEGESGKTLRDEGIGRAMNHANRVNKDWCKDAFKFLLKFLDNHSGSFMAEDVRSYAALLDFPLPPSNRAWGGIFYKARANGLIKSSGTRKVKNKKAHCANAAVWVKV